MDSAVKNLLNSLNVYNEDDYEKIWSVYEWVTSNITYDYTSYSDTARNDHKYTPYAGLILRTCVCQGYGGLVYRLLSELGVGVRYMRGYGTDEQGNYVTTGENNHGWNIVKLDGKYYHVDATWDASSPATDYYHYFLKSDADMEKHVRRDTYNTSEFNSQFPVSSTSYEIPFEVKEEPHDLYLLEGESFTMRVHHRGDDVLHFWMVKSPTASGFTYLKNSDNSYVYTNEFTRTATSSMNGTQYLASFQKDGQAFQDSQIATIYVGKTYRLKEFRWGGSHSCYAVFEDTSGNITEKKCNVNSSSLDDYLLLTATVTAPDGVTYTTKTIEPYYSCVKSVQNSIHGVELNLVLNSGNTKINIYKKQADGSYACIGSSRKTFIDKDVVRGQEYIYQFMPYYEEAGIEALSIDYERITYYPFGDATPDLGNTTYKAIYWAYDNGIVKGMDDYAYGPQLPCTRAQLCVMLWRLKGKPSVNTGNNPFSDVSTSLGNTTYKAILWAYQQGIVKGSDGRFDPNGTTTRANMAVMLWRLAGKPAVSTIGNPFADVSTDLGNTTYKAILWAYSVGLTKGTDSTHFSPGNSCTRAQLAVFLYRMNNLYRYIK